MGLNHAIAWGLEVGAELLAPRRCRACRETGLPAPAAEDPLAGLALCAACRGELEWISGVACPACGRSRGLHAVPAPRCPRCRQERRGRVGQTVALVRYRGTGRALLHRLKYSGQQDLAGPLGRALGRRLARELGGGAAGWVVAVPLHWWRRLGRGFNQAELLAAEVARELGWPLAPRHWLRRRRPTAPLYGVPKAARAERLEGVFQARLPLWAQGQPLLLVDDIRTSGATLRAAAEALSEAGGGRIDAAVAAA